MKKLMMTAAIGLMLTSGGVHAQMAVDTPTFVATAASSDQFEIKSSEMAEDKAQSEEVKAFATQMIADHTKASEELKAAAEESGAPAPGAEMMPKHAEMLQQLEGAGEAEFDARYVELQTAAHTEAVTLFRNYSESGDDQALVAFAKKTLPTLEMHLEHVEKLDAN